MVYDWVCDYLQEGEWNWKFRRAFGSEEVVEWDLLMEKLSEVRAPPKE
jgi:hypothetical protein